VAYSDRAEDAKARVAARTRLSCCAVSNGILPTSSGVLDDSPGSPILLVSFMILLTSPVVVDDSPGVHYDSSMKHWQSIQFLCCSLPFSI
jgi:hypothetical protein